MSKRLIRIIACAAVGLSPIVHAESTASWEFVQSVGGIKIGSALKDANGWTLPVECDLTGLHSITTDPTTLNSSQVIDRLHWQAEGRQLRLSVLLKNTSYATDEARCPELRLRGIEPGRYTVVYQDQQRQYPLGEVALEP